MTQAVRPIIPLERVHPPAPEPVQTAPQEPVAPAPKPLTKTAPRFRAVLQRVCEAHGLDPHDIVGPSRKPALVRARQELYFQLRQVGYSLPQIGEFCGGRDHSTVLHGIRKHIETMKG